MKSKSKPSVYPTLPFHAIRTLSLISALIVSGILIFFCYQLKVDGYKLPWTFLIVMAASFLTVIALVLTFIIHVCAWLSPLFNMILNIPILILWTTGFILLVWNMYGTLAHSCSKANWASSEGMMICRIYKALFSFVVIGLLSQVALVVLDIRSRRKQIALGRYDRMQGTELKMDPLAPDAGLSHHDPHEVPYGIDQYRDQPRDYGNPDHVRMDRFGYSAPVQQTSYDSGHYGYSDR